MKVFYLEQNDMMQKSVELALKSKSVEVYTAVPGDDFDHILADWGADLLLVDYDSAQGDLDKYLSTQIPVLITSQRAVEGEVEVVQKPYNPVSLAEKVVELIKA